MTSNPWLKGVPIIPKCPSCDARLFNGSCLDHGPPQAAEEQKQQETDGEPNEKMRRQLLIELHDV